MRNSTRGIIAVPALFAIAILVGCGGDETPGATSSSDAGTETQQTPSNKPPVIGSVTLSPWEVWPGDVVTANVEVHDPENQDVKLGYVWNLVDHRFPGGESSIEIPSTAKRGDLIRVTVTASDSTTTSAPSQATIEVQNSAPEWREISLEHDERVIPGSKITVHAVADDHDDDEVSFDTEWFVNNRRVRIEGAVLDTRDYKRGDVIHAVVIADDGDLEAEERQTDGVTLGNSDPVIVSAPGTLSRDGTFTYEVEVSDPDGDRRFQYSLESAPEGMTIDSSLGVVSWQATEDHAGVHSVEILARDYEGGEARQHFDLTVSVRTEEASPAAPDEGDRFDQDDEEVEEEEEDL